MSRLRRRSAGFTLVELLVVIGIIALLISILLPTLSKARESSKRTVCASNVRQIVYAIHLYADQYRGWAPPSQVSIDGAGQGIYAFYTRGWKDYGRLSRYRGEG